MSKRMVEAVGEVATAGLVGVVSHGTAIAVFFAAQGLSDANSFWTNMTLPDAWLIEASSVKRIWKPATSF